MKKFRIKQIVGVGIILILMGSIAHIAIPEEGRSKQLAFENAVGKLIMDTVIIRQQSLSVFELFDGPWDTVCRVGSYSNSDFERRFPSLENRWELGSGEEYWGLAYINQTKLVSIRLETHKIRFGDIRVPENTILKSAHRDVGTIKCWDRKIAQQINLRFVRKVGKYDFNHIISLKGDK